MVYINKYPNKIEKMIKIFRTIIVYLFLLYLIETKINYQKLILPLHPIQIQILYFHIEQIPHFFEIKNLFEETKSFLTSLLYITYNETKSINLTKSDFIDCTIPITQIPQNISNNSSLLLIPIISNENTSSIFNFRICEKTIQKNIKTGKDETTLINKKSGFLPLIKIIINPDKLNNLSKKYNYFFNDKLRNKITKLFIKILGFDKTRATYFNIKNNYLQLPKKNAKYSSLKFSLEKYFNMSNKSFSDYLYNNKKRKIIKFFKSKWPKSYGIYDIMSKNSSGLYNPITELTLNLFNEYSYYSVSLCDLEPISFGNYNYCGRIDKQCLNKKEIMSNYFKNYIFYKNKTFCYLDSKKNILNKQCGTKTGSLLSFNDLNFCLTKKFIQNHLDNNNEFFLKYLNNTNNNTHQFFQYKKDSIEIYENQTIYLLSNDKRCNNNLPRTLFFRNQYTNNSYINDWLNRNNRTIEEIILNDTSYFLTFRPIDISYKIPVIVLETLKNNSFIQIYEKNYWKTNIFLKSIYYKKLINNNQNFRSHYIKIGGFVNNYILSNKDNFYLNYKSMKKIFPNDYNFLTETYLYPKDKKIIYQIFENYTYNPENLWLIKPSLGSYGIGIHFFKSLNKLNASKESCLITKYISHPHLLYGIKYDLRVYVLITSIAPLKIYLYKEGLIRRATENYSLDKNKLSNYFIHLTNVQLNKFNKNYHLSEDKNSEKYSKWNFETYFKFLEANYPKMHDLKETILEQIKDVVIKTILCVQNQFYKKIIKLKYEPTNFYHLFGFDIILDENFKAYVLEVNSKPRMEIRDEVDKNVKSQLIPDMFNLLGIVPFNKNKRSEAYDKNYTLLKNKKLNSLYESVCEFYRPTGNFERIFPKVENIQKYEKFFIKNNDYNLLLWKQMLNESEIN